MKFTVCQLLCRVQPDPSLVSETNQSSWKHDLNLPMLKILDGFIASFPCFTAVTFFHFQQLLSAFVKGKMLKRFDLYKLSSHQPCLFHKACSTGDLSYGSNN